MKTKKKEKKEEEGPNLNQSVECFFCLAWLTGRWVVFNRERALVVRCICRKKEIQALIFEQNTDQTVVVLYPRCKRYRHPFGRVGSAKYFCCHLHPH